MASKSRKKRQEVFSITDGRCYYCGEFLDFESFHMDHVKPKSAGGKVSGNLVPSCVDCNLSKGNLSIEEFREILYGMATNTHIGRIMAKYNSVKPMGIHFYFERSDSDGTL